MFSLPLTLSLSFSFRLAPCIHSHTLTQIIPTVGKRLLPWNFTSLVETNDIIKNIKFLKGIKALLIIYFNANWVLVENFISNVMKTRHEGSTKGLSGMSNGVHPSCSAALSNKLWCFIILFALLSSPLQTSRREKIASQERTEKTSELQLFS